MPAIQKSVEVKQAVRTVYNQWTRFESFPGFMEGVKSVRRLDDKKLHWRAVVAGKELEWDAEITGQIRDERIGWRSISGAVNAGLVSFFPMGEDSTKVTLRLEYDPEQLAGNVGDALGLMAARVEGDLARFKDFIESREVETAARHGEIDRGRLVDNGSRRNIHRKERIPYES